MLTVKHQRVEFELGDRKVLEPFSEVVERWESIREDILLPGTACWAVAVMDCLITTLARFDLLLEVLLYLPSEVNFGKRPFLSSCLGYV